MMEYSYISGRMVPTSTQEDGMAEIKKRHQLLAQIAALQLGNRLMTGYLLTIIFVLVVAAFI